jgi:multidrug resistance efflux pump
MSDDDFRRMSESQLIDMTLAAGQGGFDGAERMRYARAQAELNRREREHQNSLAAQSLQVAEVQAKAAQAATQSSRNAARATWGLVYLARHPHRPR